MGERKKYGSDPKGPVLSLSTNVVLMKKSPSSRSRRSVSSKSWHTERSSSELELAFAVMMSCAEKAILKWGPSTRIS